MVGPSARIERWSGRSVIAGLDRGLIGLLLVTLLLVGCVPGDDDDEDPTATPVPSPVSCSPAPSEASPPVRAIPGCLPPVPVASPTATREPAASPTSASVAPPATTEDEESAAAAASPTEEASPATGSPSAARTGVYEVDSCEVDLDELPDPQFRTVEVIEDEVNFRTGPGTDCDAIGALDSDTRATLLSGPVVRSDEDPDLEWVMIRVDETGTEGWVAAEFLERPT